MSTDEFWKEQIAEDDRLAIEGLLAWEESTMREREEAIRAMAALLHPPAYVSIDWLKEGF